MTSLVDLVERMPKIIQAWKLTGVPLRQINWERANTLMCQISEFRRATAEGSKLPVYSQRSIAEAIIGMGEGIVYIPPPEMHNPADAVAMWLANGNLKTAWENSWHNPDRFLKSKEVQDYLIGSD